MRLTANSTMVMEIARFIYEKTGKYYETHSSGFVDLLRYEHEQLVRDNFSGKGVRLNGVLI